MKKKTLLILLSALLVLAPQNAYASSLPTIGSASEQQDATVTSDSTSSSTASSSDPFGTGDGDDTYTSEPYAQENTADTDTSLNLVNGKADFDVTLLKGETYNRFEIFYVPTDAGDSGTDNAPTMIFTYGNNSNTYMAEYGSSVDNTYPVSVQMGKSVTVKNTDGQDITFNMLVVYFNTEKTDMADGGTASVTLNAAQENPVIITRTQSPDPKPIDMEETRQPIFKTTDPAFLLKYSLNGAAITGKQIVSIVGDTSAQPAEPSTHHPKKPDPTASRIKLIAFLAVIAGIVIAIKLFKNKKKNEEKNAERNEKRKAVRKQKENMVRDRDRLSSALKEFDDDYSDDDFYTKQEEEAEEAAEEEAMNEDAEEEGMQQIPQDKIARYSPGIKEALYTKMEPEDEELVAKRESLIKEREETIAMAENSTPTQMLHKAVKMAEDTDDIPVIEEDEGIPEEEISSLIEEPVIDDGMMEGASENRIIDEGSDREKEDEEPAPVRKTPAKTVKKAPAKKTAAETSKTSKASADKKNRTASSSTSADKDTVTAKKKTSASVSKSTGSTKKSVSADRPAVKHAKASPATTEKPLVKKAEPGVKQRTAGQSASAAKPATKTARTKKQKAAKTADTVRHTAKASSSADMDAVRKAALKSAKTGTSSAAKKAVKPALKKTVPSAKPKRHTPMKPESRTHTSPRAVQKEVRNRIPQPGPAGLGHVKIKPKKNNIVL